MNRRDIVVGVVILLVVAGVVFIRSRQSGDSTGDDLQIPQTLSVEDTIEDKFNLQIPDDVDKAELKNVQGGTGSAIATRKFENGQFTHTILADLPELESGSYTAELGEGDQVISTGTLNLAKGGFLLEFHSAQDLTNLNKVRVKSGETTVLEGDF